MRIPPAVLTLGALVLAALVWWLGGRLLAALSLGALDLVGPLCLVFFALTLVERGLARLLPPPGDHP